MNELVHGLDGVFTYMDDILIYGKDKAEHDKRLNKVTKVLASAGLKLNQDNKSVIGQSYLKFLGRSFDANGIRSCPDKVAVTCCTDLLAVRIDRRLRNYYLADTCDTSCPMLGTDGRADHGLIRRICCSCKLGCLFLSASYHHLFEDLSY